MCRLVHRKPDCLPEQLLCSAVGSRPDRASATVASWSIGQCDPHSSASSSKPALASIKDLTFRESLMLFPLAFLTILFGVYPKPVLDISAASVQQLVNNYNAAVTAVKAAALMQ